MCDWSSSRTLQPGDEVTAQTLGHWGLLRRSLARRAAWSLDGAGCSVRVTQPGRAYRRRGRGGKYRARSLLVAGVLVRTGPWSQMEGKVAHCCWPADAHLVPAPVVEAAQEIPGLEAVGR